MTDPDKEKIYIADDDANIREGVKAFLKSEGYRVRAFENGDLLFDAFQKEACDLVILDVMMPGSDGFVICGKIREISQVPIIILTARDSELDYATGINLGGDDYFAKPFSALSLVMRVKAIFRRIRMERDNFLSKNTMRELVFGDISLDETNKTAKLKGEKLALTPNEFNLLSYMINNQNRAVSRDELLDSVWGYSAEMQSRAADDTVLRLRKKIAGGNVEIESVWGFGFRIKERHGA